MSASDIKPQLPSGPSSLCFDKDDFMKENFSIDHFVSECRKNVQLETLKDDLGVYMKVLRSALVELINQDYADFVNLSSNLVGLDKAIGNISVPLERLKEDVSATKTGLDDTIEKIEQKLGQIKQIRKKKVSLQLLMASVQCVERIENQLKARNGGEMVETDVKLDGDLMERMSSEFNRLHFVISKSKNLPAIENLKPKILRFTNILQKNLENAFMSGYRDKDLDSLKQCLRIYATINKTKDAEELFRKRVVASYLETVIADNVWKNHPKGLQGMYSKVLDFIPRHCSEIRLITNSSIRDSVGGFDFLVNSFWPEVVTGLEVRTPLLCDLTNPRTFQERYLVTIEFLEKFEEECGNVERVTRLRDHPSYTSFISKWNLAVYFQIRFQEIAGSFESSLLKSIRDIGNTDDDGFLLPQTQTMWRCVATCWSSEVYLGPLVHRFSKLTLLLWSRYASWASDIIKKEVSVAQETSSQSVTVGDERPSNGLPDKTRDDDVSVIVALVTDVMLLQTKIPIYVNDVVLPHLKSCITDKLEMMNECVKDTCNSLEELVPQFDRLVTDRITSRSLVSLKLVNDIPRLFRRMNREVPNKPSSYVVSCLKPLQSFLSDHGRVLPPVCSKSWTLVIISNITQQYLTFTSDVLTSVKRMEDSLKRLKMARDKNTSSASGLLSGMSDDDKIRLQLALDVEYYGKQIIQFGLDASDVTSFQQLSELVESARSSPSTS